MKKVLYLGIVISTMLSFIEASGVMDSHHDILMIIHSLFLYDGLMPYKEFYVQYGVLQHLATSILFRITGINLFSQNLVVIASYSIFVLYNYRIMNILVKNTKTSCLYALLLLSLEPFIILPWPNFIIGAFCAIGLFYAIRFILNKNINDLFIANLLICLVPLTRSNAGLLFSILMFIWTTFECFNYNKKFNLLKLFASSLGLLFYFGLFFSNDFVTQTFTLPQKYYLPYLFGLPNDPISLIKLHYQLFIVEKNLLSVVSTTQSLFFWRYVLILGIALSFYRILTNFLILFRNKNCIINANLKIYCLLTICGISASSSVFPIFDSFRAINSWFPFLIIIIINIHTIYYKYFIINILLVFLIIFFCISNLINTHVSVIGLMKRFDYRSIQFQFVNLRNFNDISSYSDIVNKSGFNTFSSKKFIYALDINPFVKYSQLKTDLNKHCRGKYFYSDSKDYMVYLLQDNFTNLLPHKMFISPGIFDKNGNYIDINYLIYPDFYDSFNKRPNLCIFLHKSTYGQWLKKLNLFTTEIDYGEHKLFIR